MTPKSFREAFLKWPSAYRDALLSRDQHNLYLIVQQKPRISSSEVAVALDISVQSASTRLVALRRKGYIDRTPVVAESGGIEYVYSAKVLP